MRRRVVSTALIGSLMTAAVVACGAPPAPTISFAWHNLDYSTIAGTKSGHVADYTYKASNFPNASTVSLERLQAGRWTIVNTAFAKASGSGSTLPPYGRDSYRLVLSDLSGKVLAVANQRLDVYDNIGFSTMYSIPTKHLGSDDFDYQFRDMATMRSSSCEVLNMTILNAGATAERVSMTFTDQLGNPSHIEPSIDPSKSLGLIVSVRPNTDWSIATQGADLYVNAFGICYTSDGKG
jgi:hypothetical protein